MVKTLLATKDIIVGAMGNPFTAPNEAAGKREWGYAVATEFKNPEPKVNPLDLQLWCLGTFDDETGKIKNDIHLVAQAIEFKKETGYGIQEPNE